MIKKIKSKYDYKETLEKLKEAFKEYGWEIKGEHFPGKYHNKNIHTFEICKEEYAKKIIENEENHWVAPMMPCRITVCEEKDGTYIYSMNYKLMYPFLPKQVKNIFKEVIKEEEKMIEKVKE